MDAWTTIRYLHAEGVGIRAIGRELGVSRKAVRHALRHAGPPRYRRPARPNPQLVPYARQIATWYFQQQLIGSRIVRELRALGYVGSASAVYAHLKRLRATVPSARATARFETAPGRQAQFDWSPYTVDLGGAPERVIVYGLTLGYSRRKHDTASRDETQASIFEALEAGLRHFGGVAQRSVGRRGRWQRRVRGGFLVVRPDAPEQPDEAGHDKQHQPGPQPIGRPGTIGRSGSMKVVTAAISVTRAVTSAPTPFTAALSCQCGPRSAHQWRTMPAWERVKAAKTLRAYSGSNAPVDPPKSTTSSALSSPSSRMPFENARRSPPKASWCGA